jgi:hypothetical protein
MVQIVGGGGDFLTILEDNAMPFLRWYGLPATSEAGDLKIVSFNSSSNSRTEIQNTCSAVSLFEFESNLLAEHFSQFREAFKNCSSELFFCYFGRS